MRTFSPFSHCLPCPSPRGLGTSVSGSLAQTRALWVCAQHPSKLVHDWNLLAFPEQGTMHAPVGFSRADGLVVTILGQVPRH